MIFKSMDLWSKLWGLYWADYTLELEGAKFLPLPSHFVQIDTDEKKWNSCRTPSDLACWWM